MWWWSVPASDIGKVKEAYERWQEGAALRDDMRSGFTFGGITFEEAKEVFVCKIICKTHLKEEDLDKEIIQFYEANLAGFKSTKPHGQYIGEIIGHYTKWK